MATHTRRERILRDPSLQGLREHLEPVSLAGQKQLAVPEALTGLFPPGGAPSGWSIGVTGARGGLGAWSLAAAVVAALVEADRWAAFVGAEAFGLVMAEELGLPLDRVLMVEHPPADRWGTVVAALLEAVSVICLNPTSPLPPRDARRLAARAREQEAILVHLDGGRAWPQGLDLELTIAASRWEGLEAGHGRLRQRRAIIEATGKRSMARARRVEVLLPGPDGSLASAVEPVLERV